MSSDPIEQAVDIYLAQAGVIVDKSKARGAAVLAELEAQARGAAADLAAGDAKGFAVRGRAVRRYLGGCSACWRIEVARAHNRALREILSLGFDFLLSTLASL